MGAAFSAMLPIVGVIAAIAIIDKLIERHEAAQAAIRKVAIETENLTIKQNDQSKSLELTNLKLDDQIATSSALALSNLGHCGRISISVDAKIRPVLDFS